MDEETTEMKHYQHLSKQHTNKPMISKKEQARPSIGIEHQVGCIRKVNVRQRELYSGFFKTHSLSPRASEKI